jgi:hypothetical protein
MICRVTSAQIQQNSQILGFMGASGFVVTGTKVEKTWPDPEPSKSQSWMN